MESRFASIITYTLWKMTSQEGPQMDSGRTGDKPCTTGSLPPYLQMSIGQFPATPLYSHLTPRMPPFLAFNFQTPHRLLTWLDVFSDDGDMLVSVWPGMFVPKPNHVAQLMSHNAKLVTVFPNGYGLWASSSSPNIGTTAGQLQK